MNEAKTTGIKDGGGEGEGEERVFSFASISLKIPLPILYLEAFSNVFNQGAFVFVGRA
jgi:hypothetical protein